MKKYMILAFCMMAVWHLPLRAQKLDGVEPDHQQLFTNYLNTVWGVKDRIYRNPIVTVGGWPNRKEIKLIQFLLDKNQGNENLSYGSAKDTRFVRYQNDVGPYKMDLQIFSLHPDTISYIVIRHNLGNSVVKLLFTKLDEKELRAIRQLGEKWDGAYVIFDKYDWEVYQLIFSKIYRFAEKFLKKSA